MNTTTTIKSPFNAITIGAAVVATLALILAVIAVTRPAPEPASAEEDRSWDCSAEVVRIAPAEDADQDLDRRVEIVATAVQQVLGDAAVTVEVLDAMPTPEDLIDTDTPTGVNLVVAPAPRGQGYEIDREAAVTEVAVSEIVDRTRLAGELRSHLPACAKEG